MSHATYLFLVSEGDHGVDSEPPWDTWKSQVERYVDHHGDENNWYTVLVGVRHDGEVHVYDEERTHISSDGAVMFADAMRLSMGCIASEIQLSGSPGISLPGMEVSAEVERLHEMTYEEIRQEIVSQAFAALGWEFSKLSTQTWDQIADRADFSRGTTEEMGKYQLLKMAQAMICFISSAVPPFTQRHCSPYAYRCFDLRREDYNSVDLTNCAIIYVDIHT